LVPLFWSIQSAYWRLTQNFPQSPWESEILTDAWRVNHGLPVYTMPKDDHATHMYGPLITYAVAAIFRVTGFNITAARWISLVSTILLTVGLAAGFTRRRGSLVFAIALVLLSMQFYRARAYAAESRPDCVSVLFSALAVWMFYFAHTRRAGWIIGGTAAMLIGFGFKQNAAAVAVVPATAVLFTRPQPLKRHLLLAAVPLAAVAITILAIKVYAPVVYFYIATVYTIVEHPLFDGSKYSLWRHTPVGVKRKKPKTANPSAPAARPTDAPRRICRSNRLS
jgi:hypothetical protein